MRGSTVEHQMENFMVGVVRRNPGETEFHQAVEEVAASVIPYIIDKPIYTEYQILERMAEPDRVITFRVCWENDDHQIRTQRGYRIQNNNSIGPYKGGIRFHPSVTLSVLKFLAFEQTFKNSLTGLPMGGGKGGADFNPKGKSDHEVMRFCQSFINELYRHIGEDTDVPAGDIACRGAWPKRQEQRGVRSTAAREGRGFGGASAVEDLDSVEGLGHSVGMGWNAGENRLRRGDAGESHVDEL